MAQHYQSTKNSEVPGLVPETQYFLVKRFEQGLLVFSKQYQGLKPIVGSPDANHSNVSVVNKPDAAVIRELLEVVYQGLGLILNEKLFFVLRQQRVPELRANELQMVVAFPSEFQDFEDTSGMLRLACKQNVLIERELDQGFQVPNVKHLSDCLDQVEHFKVLPHQPQVVAACSQGRDPAYQQHILYHISN